MEFPNASAALFSMGRLCVLSRGRADLNVSVPRRRTTGGSHGDQILSVRTKPFRRNVYFGRAFKVNKKKTSRDF